MKYALCFRVNRIFHPRMRQEVAHTVVGVLEGERVSGGLAVERDIVESRVACRTVQAQLLAQGFKRW